MFREGSTDNNQCGIGSKTSRRGVLRWLGATGATLSGVAGSAGAERRRPPRQGRDGDSPPPGPALLYDDPVTPPQLAPDGVWDADPLMVSGASAYVDGEYLALSFPFDDYGAETGHQGEQPPTDTFSQSTGDIVYPTDEETYRHNAADLLEFRVRTFRGEAVYRITLNTMIEPDAAGVALGIDTDGANSAGSTDWGYGLGDLGAPVDHVVVSWGTGAQLTNLETGETTEVQSTVDLQRNQIELTVPIAPDGATWRHYLVCGLFDPNAGQFKQIQEEPDDENPGGANGGDPPPVFSVGFRSHVQEPVGGVNLDVGTAEEQLAAAREGGSHGNWRDHAQAKALADRDISAFHADVDFGQLDRRVTERAVPRTGFINRVYGSRFDLGEGVVTDHDGGGSVAMLGRVQPYAIYVPSTYSPDEPAPLHLAMHGSTANHNQWPVSSPNYLRQLGEERDAIVVSPQGRGPSLSYVGVSELDVIEVLADVLYRYSVDLERTTVSGYSMGAVGTYRLGGKYPDLFAKGFPIVGSEHVGPHEEGLVPDTGIDAIDGSVEDTLGRPESIIRNLRHVPFLLWNGSNDELANPVFYTSNQQKFHDLGYRHELDVFLGYDHFTFSIRDRWGRARDFLDGAFLGDPAVEANPARVTYRRVPDDDVTEYGLVHDGAYWVDGVQVATDRVSGTIDLHSKARGEAAPIAENYRGAETDPHPLVKRGTRWLEGIQDPPPRNALAVDLDGVTGATIYVDEAGLDATRPIDLVIDATHEATVELVSRFGTATVSVTPGHHEESVHVRRG